MLGVKRTLKFLRNFLSRRFNIRVGPKDKSLIVGDPLSTSECKNKKYDSLPFSYLFPNLISSNLESIPFLLFLILPQDTGSFIIFIPLPYLSH